MPAGRRLPPSRFRCREERRSRRASGHGALKASQRGWSSCAPRHGHEEVAVPQRAIDVAKESLVHTPVKVLVAWASRVRPGADVAALIFEELPQVARLV